MKAQDLKNSILQLAVQGKLVPQDPSDEPANELLARIREERAELIEQKKIKKPKGGESIIYRKGGSWYERRGKGDPVCIDGEIPFDIPDSWEWARLSSLGEIVGGGTPKTGDATLWANGEIGHPWLTPADMKHISGMYAARGERNISDKGLASSSARLMPKGTVLMSSRAPIGYIAIAANEISTNQGFKSVVPQSAELSIWLYWAIQGEMDDIKQRASGTTFKEISGSEFGLTLIPIPPLAEQQRIVAKVDELMPLAEEYGKLENAREALDAALPDRLRKSVLQLAVEGKLVPQDPSDEPASDLLVRIREERAELIEQRKIRRPKGGESVIYRKGGSWYERRGKGDPVCIDGEIPFDIPESWEWVRLESLCRVIVDCPHSTPQYLANETGYIAIDTNCIDDRWHQTDGRNLSKESYESRVSKYVPQIGDIVFTREGSIGRSVILARENVCLGQRVMLMSTEPYALYNKYCQIVLSSAYAWSIYKKANVGTGVKHINVATVKSLLVPIPPLAEQRRIVEKLDQIMKLIGA